MSLKIQTLMQIIEGIAPKKLAEDWDNVGLLIGNPSKEVKRLLIALDIDEMVLEEAVNLSCDMIITHHPIIFKPLKAIREDLPSGKLIAELIRHNIAVYAAHTNLDTAKGGVNDVLASLLALEDIQILSADKQEKLYKLVVFVPKDQSENLRSAMSAAGAGHIGNYSSCFFASEGIGTFLPLEGTNPFIGKIGQLEKVEEVRLETIVPASKLKKVLAAMLKAHPYEEVAYDVYSLENESVKLGVGRIGTLPTPVTLAELSKKVKSVLGLSNVRVAGDTKNKITKVAVVGGAGASYISLAAFRGAQCLITGDIKYHEAQDALQKKLSIIDAGHFETEVPVISHLAAQINTAVGNINEDVEIIVSNSQSTPFVFM